MSTNLALDDALVEEAKEIGHHKTKKDAVTAALREYIRRRQQMRIVELFGTIDFDPAYDYKAERWRTKNESDRGYPRVVTGPSPEQSEP